MTHPPRDPERLLLNRPPRTWPQRPDRSEPDGQRPPAMTPEADPMPVRIAAGSDQYHTDRVVSQFPVSAQVRPRTRFTVHPDCDAFNASEIANRNLRHHGDRIAVRDANWRRTVFFIDAMQGLYKRRIGR